MLVANSCRTLLSDILVTHSCHTLHTHVIQSCGTLSWDTLVTCRTLLWGTLLTFKLRSPCRTSSKSDVKPQTSSTSDISMSSLQNEHFIQLQDFPKSPRHALTCPTKFAPHVWTHCCFTRNTASMQALQAQISMAQRHTKPPKDRPLLTLQNTAPAQPNHRSHFDMLARYAISDKSDTSCFHPRPPKVFPNGRTISISYCRRRTVANGCKRSLTVADMKGSSRKFASTRPPNPQELNEKPSRCMEKALYTTYYTTTIQHAIVYIIR